MSSLMLRIRHFLRTGSLRHPALSSNISVAATANEKIVKAKATIQEHKYAIGVQRIALDSLKDQRDAVVTGYNKVHAETDKLLASL